MINMILLILVTGVLILICRFPSWFLDDKRHILFVFLASTPLLLFLDGQNSYTIQIVLVTPFFVFGLSYLDFVAFGEVPETYKEVFGSKTFHHLINKYSRHQNKTVLVLCWSKSLNAYRLREPVDMQVTLDARMKNYVRAKHFIDLMKQVHSPDIKVFTINLLTANWVGLEYEVPADAMPCLLVFENGEITKKFEGLHIERLQTMGEIQELIQKVKEL